jgi:hypothetical protein
VACSFVDEAEQHTDNEDNKYEADSANDVVGCNVYRL